MEKQNQDQQKEGLVQVPEAKGEVAPIIQHTDRTEIDVQIATAHAYPRSIARFRQVAHQIACADEETAASCFYTLKRGGKKIEGPGVRLAEIVGSAWGNLRYGARIVREENDFIVAQGTAHDLETNVACSIEVKRRITTKDGKRYNADMIGVTANAACSIALRNAIFKVVPKTFVDIVYELAKKTAIGNQATLDVRRQKAIEFFSKLHVTEKQICTYCEVEGVADIGLKQLEDLTGLKTALQDGDTKVDDIFPPEDAGPKRKSETKEPEKTEAPTDE